ncbi:MAG: HlyD family efflux transporter periplasmic adaptor subunit [Bacteroidales bacterium]
MKKLFAGILPVLLLFGCKTDLPQADAWGNFEADEIIVSSESTGKLLQFHVEEGTRVKKGEPAGLQDTTDAVLKIRQLKSQKRSVAANTEQIDAQLEVYRQQLANLEKDHQRISSLLSSGAATQKQLDDIEGQMELIEKQLQAAGTQKQVIMSQLQVIDDQIAQAEEMYRRCFIRNPADGTVLNTFVHEGEWIPAGKPLYKMAALDEIWLRVYISGKQLPEVALGQKVTVLVDSPDQGLQEFPGTIAWISDKAEFTPRIIQTREERVNLVYAVKIKVPNDGTLKIGMPGEVKF